MIRIICRKPDKAKPGEYEATIDHDDYRHIVVTGYLTVFAPAARALLAAGCSPDTMITMRWEGKPYDSFHPVALGKVAK